MLQGSQTACPDLVSIVYVLVERLAGQLPFVGLNYLPRFGRGQGFWKSARPNYCRLPITGINAASNRQAGLAIWKRPGLLRPGHDGFRLASNR